MRRLRVLIVSDGAPGHIIGWRLAQSPEKPDLYFAPGNAGTEEIGTNIPLSTTDVRALLNFAKGQGVDLTIVCPERSLQFGITDLFRFRQNGLAIVGPSRAAAEIEISKLHGKLIMSEADIRTADWIAVSNYEDARGYAENASYPLVAKANGLADGKGVIVCQDEQEALQAIKIIMKDRSFGDAGKVMLFEERLWGKEYSVHALCSGSDFTMLPLSVDYKREKDEDVGLNTGGMGAHTIYHPKLMLHVEQTIVKSVLQRLVTRGTPFIGGILYPGIMVSPEGYAYVLEFNVRPGNPEAMVIFSVLDGDLFPTFVALANGKIVNPPVWNNRHAVCVYLCSKGYPHRKAHEYEKKQIHGLDKATQRPNVQIFHGATIRIGDRIYTNGGRVLAVTAQANTVREARGLAYQTIDEDIWFEDMYYRTDIGAGAIGAIV